MFSPLHMFTLHLSLMVDNGDSLVWASGNPNMDRWTFEEDFALSYVFWIQMTRVAVVMEMTRIAKGVQQKDENGNCTGCIGCMAHDDMGLTGYAGNIIKRNINKVQNGTMTPAIVPFEWLQALLYHFPDSLKVQNGIFLPYITEKTKRLLLPERNLTAWVKDTMQQFMQTFSTYHCNMWDSIFTVVTGNDCTVLPKQIIDRRVVQRAKEEARKPSAEQLHQWAAKKERDVAKAAARKERKAAKKEKPVVTQKVYEVQTKKTKRKCRKARTYRKARVPKYEAQAVLKTVEGFIGGLSREEKKALLYQDKVEAEWQELRITRDERGRKGVMSGHGKKKSVKRRNL